MFAACSGASEAAEIVAFCDDDPAVHGTRLWNWPVIGPDEVNGLGIEAVVISSHLHEAAIWGRRGVYTSQGIEVVRLYG